MTEAITINNVFYKILILIHYMPVGEITYTVIPTERQQNTQICVYRMRIESIGVVKSQNLSGT